MTIETKFKEGDTIWFIHESKAIETSVCGIKIDRRPIKGSVKIEQEIIYLCSKDKYESQVFIKVDEFKAFLYGIITV